MPTYAQRLLAQQGQGLTYAQRLLQRQTGRGLTPLPELRATAAELERMAAETGAVPIEQDRPGVFRILIDLLSRPNYAVAGFFDELIQTQSVTGAVGRAMTEFFSGIGGLEGQKEAWGKVLEDAGVGTKTLADVFPMLEGTWVGAMGSRGAAGLTLDIFTDPLTYMSFGATGLRATLPKAGRFILGPKGTERFLTLQKTSKNMDEALEAFEKELIDESGKILQPDYIAPGGMRFAGKPIPGTEKISPYISDKVKAAAAMVPGGDRALKGATEFGKGLNDVVGAMFDPFYRLKLPARMRSVAIQMNRAFVNNSAAHRAPLFNMFEGMNAEYRKLLKKHPNLGEQFYQAENLGKVDQIPEEARDLYERVRGMYDSMAATEVNVGIRTEEQVRQHYLSHYYGNAEDFHEIWAVHLGRGAGGTSPKHLKERVFATFDDAVARSKELHEISVDLNKRGIVSKIYPVLEPEYDVMKNLRRYIDQHATLLARKTWMEEAVAKFGKTVDDFDIDALYDLELPRIEPGAEYAPIETLFSTTPSVDDLAKALPKLSKVQRQEAIRKYMADRVRGKSGLMEVREKLDRWADDFPMMRVIKDGDAVDGMYRTHYGEQARYVSRKGSFWGEDEVLVPQAIADDIENWNTRFLNTREHKWLGKMLRKVDWFNNTTRMGLYPFWPASFFRDWYSNIYLSMLDTGVGLLNPAHRADVVRVMAGAEGSLTTAGGFTKTFKELKKEFQDHGIFVPGERFVEVTEGAAPKFLRKAMRVRGLMENEARAALALQHVRRGVPVKDAADMVGEFLFNYNELTPFHREVLKRGLLFPTFTIRNIQRHAKTLATRPGAVINQLKPFRGLKEDNEQMIAWEAEALKIRLNKDGKTIHMLTGIDLPLRNLDTLWGGSISQTLRAQMGMVTPLLKTIPELALGKDTFLGRDITRIESQTVGRFIETMNPPKRVKDWLGYKKDTDAAGRPRYSFDGPRFTLIFKSWMFSRLISTTDRQFRGIAVEGGDAASIALDILTGIREKELNLDDQMRRRLQERIRMLEQSLVRRGELREFTKRYEPRG